MSESTITPQEIGDLVRRLCVALSNVETFSADHLVAKKQITSAYKYLAGLLQRQNKPLVITVADKRIVFDQSPIEERSPVAAKFATRLEDNHINHLTFDPGLTAAELEGFYRVLGKGSKFINAHGGLPALFEAAQITHVKVRRLDFVMVGEDQKVVSKTAVVAGENEKVVGKTAMVVESPAGKERFQDIIAIQEVLQKVVEHTDEQKWLLDEMKKDPRRIADLFVEGIKLATSKMEAGMTGQSAGSEALLKSIQILGDVLVTGEASTPPEDRADLERFIIILEEEIRQCSVQLISSKVAAGLLTEIIKAITSYADQVRAHKIAEEFLRGDKSIKKVGRLLRDLTPATESVENLVSRIRKYLLERGLTEDDLARLEQTIKTAHKPKPPRKLRKRSSEAIARGIAERLKDLNLEPALLEEIIARLCKFIEDVVREKAGELRLDIETLRSQLASHENVLHDLPGGVVLWNAEGKVEFLSHAAAKALGSETGVELGATLKARLCEWNFPLSTPAPPSTELSAAEIQLLRSVSFVFKDKTGGIHGVLINV